MTGRATNAMLLQGAAPRERGPSTGAFAVRLVAGPRRSTAIHGTALYSALIAHLEGSILLSLVLPRTPPWKREIWGGFGVFW